MLSKNSSLFTCVVSYYLVQLLTCWSSSVSYQEASRSSKCSCLRILRTPRSEHISPLIQNLHWLPVNRRILHNVAALCHTSLFGSGPQCLSDLTHVYTLALFRRYLFPEHSQCQTKVPWSAFFCLPWSHCMEFFATRTQTSTGM